MSRGSENKKWLRMIVMIVVCLALVGTARADWPEQARLFASDGAANDRFGQSVCLDGDYAIVGAWYGDGNDPNSGSAYVFRLNGSSWTEQAKLTASDGAADDFFGQSVSISGDYVIVGAPYDNTLGGSAYIFKRDGSRWTQQAKLLTSDGTTFDLFGKSVSISDDYAIVGADHDDNNEEDSGSAYIFKRNGASWTEEAKLLASDGVANDLFGNSVSISGDYAIVGAPFDYPDGAAYVFKRDGTSWIEQAKLTAPGGAAGRYFSDPILISSPRPHDSFGRSVSISGDYAIVGAYADDSNGTHSGSAYIFKRDGSSWTEQVKLSALDGGTGDIFGWSVSISRDYAIIGAAGGDGNEPDSGSAYIFKRSDHYDGPNWCQQAKLIASDGATSDVFGRSVSISRCYAIVGASYDDENGEDSGSAYVFKKVCPTGDLSGDCFVDSADLAILCSQWLQGN